jgi:hypothetical protein
MYTYKELEKGKLTTRKIEIPLDIRLVEGVYKVSDKADFEGFLMRFRLALRRP